MTQKEDPGRGARALLLGKLGCGAAGRAGPTMGPQRLLLPLCSPGLRPRRCQRGDSGCASRKRPVRPARWEPGRPAPGGGRCPGCSQRRPSLRGQQRREAVSVPVRPASPPVLWVFKLQSGAENATSSLNIAGAAWRQGFDPRVWGGKGRGPGPPGLRGEGGGLDPGSVMYSENLKEHVMWGEKNPLKFLQFPPIFIVWEQFLSCWLLSSLSKHLI